MKSRFANFVPLALLASGALAQESPIAEVVVTAERRAENEQHVPISMSVLTGEELAQHIQVSSDIGQLIPNVQLEAPVGFGIPRTGIRGISSSDFNGNATTTIMVYLDDLPLNAPISQGIPLWDLARTEVLRGPQGTLFGRNATAGAIRYISAQPSKETESTAELTLGRFNQAKATAALSGPITDTLRARVSFLVNKRDGDTKNVTLGTDEGRQNYYGVRAILDFDPGENLSMQLMAQYFRSDQDLDAWKSTPGLTSFDAFGPAPSPLVNGYASVAALQAAYGFENLGPGSNYKLYESDVPSAEHIEHTPVTLTVNWKLPGSTLTSVTGFLDVYQHYVLDNDSTPAPILSEIDNFKDRQWSQEFRLTSNNDGPLDWIAGAFYLKENMSGSLDVDATAWRGNVDYGFPDANTVMYRRGAVQETSTYAGFLHTNYQINPVLSATAGVRYTYEKKNIDYRFRSQWEFATDVPRTGEEFNDFNKAVASGDFGNLLAAANDPISASKHWSELSWKVGLNYQSTERTLVYGLISRGFKGGSFKPTANTAGEVLNTDGSVLSVRPELITDFEVGVKSDVIPGRVRVNAGIFYYDYKDYQTDQLDPNTASQVISNLPKAKVYGTELELQLAPVEGLFVSFGGGYVHTKITDAIDPSLIGHKLPFAEDLNFNAVVRYDVRTALGTFSPEISGKHYGKYYTTKENNALLGNYNMLNARIGFESASGRIFGSLWGKNLTDKMVPIVIDDATEFFGSNIAFINQHETYGISIGAKF